MTATQAPSVFEIYEGTDFLILGEYYKEYNRLFLHLEWETKEFSKSFYQEGLLAIAAIRKHCRLNDIPDIWVYVPKELEKFENMFGFTTVWTEGSNLLMRQET